MKIKISEIEKLCTQILEKNGLSKKDSKLIVDEYVEGKLRGKECHGFSAFRKFAVRCLRSKYEKHKILRDEDCYMLVDGRGGMGQIVLNDILPSMIKKAKKKGIAMLGIFNMHSYLMPGTFARKAANEDILAIFCNYGGNPRICPFGSIDPVFATNPIAVGIPSDGSPIVVDMATSKTAMGKVRLAEKLGRRLEDGIAIDKDGSPTQDPDKAMEGALFPFGGYKGSALALTVEVLSRVMFNIPLGKNIKGKRGYFFIFIDPSKFGDLKDFKNNVSDLKEKIKDSRKAKGVEEIFVPGEQGDKIKIENLKKGYFDIDKNIIEEIKGLLR